MQFLFQYTFLSTVFCYFSIFILIFVYFLSFPCCHLNKSSELPSYSYMIYFSYIYCVYYGYYFSRLEWESAVLRGASIFEALEEERLSNLKSVLTSYLYHNNELRPRLIEVNKYATQIIIVLFTNFLLFCRPPTGSKFQYHNANPPKI